MNSLNVAPGRPRVYCAVLSGGKATFTNEFRRRSFRFQDLLNSLGFPANKSVIQFFLISGHAVTLLIVVVGIFWTPQPAGLTSLGIPLRTPDMASLVGVLLAMGLLQARRRFKRVHRKWGDVSPPLEAGMRAGLVLMDFGLAGMLVIQNLRWHESSNILTAGALAVSAVLVVTPKAGKLPQGLALAACLLGLGGLSLLVMQLDWPPSDNPLWHGFAAKAFVVLAGTLFTAVATPALYMSTAHPLAFRSRGLMTDIFIKTGSVFFASAVALNIVQLTPWIQAAPFVATTVFFLGLVLVRSTFARVSSPEALGFALFMVRLRPGSVRPLVARGLLAAVVLVLPATAALVLLLLWGAHFQAAVLLIALVALEISIDALIIQRRTAVMPASHIAALSQKSKTGLGAALCAGLAVTFSGILGTVTPHAAQGPGITIAAAAFVLVAILLTGLVFNDAPAWIRKISATATEDK